MNDITFKWSNYTKPTPANLERLAAGLRRIVAGIALSTIIMEADWRIPFSILVVGLILDELKVFFASAKDDYNEVVSINIPSKVVNQVEITHNEKEPDPDP